MRKTRCLNRTVSAILALCMLLLFASCADKNDTESNDTDEAAAGESLSVVTNGSSDYTIVWHASATEAGEKKAGSHLKSQIKEATGAELEIVTDFGLQNGGKELPDKAIFVGRVDVDGADTLWEGLGENDYKVSVKDNDIYIVGGSGTAVYYGVLYFKNSFIDKDTKSLTVSSNLEYVFEGADSREDYLDNPDRLLHDWIIEFETPKGMLDFEEKKQSLNTYDGRMMVFVHRGDAEHYPENSLEAIISAYAMGADGCEVDVRVTKDGVPILYHDDSIAKKTNYNEISGKTIDGITFPKSDNIADWTFKQVGYLRYKNTDYKIATLEEAIKVMKGRMFLYCDRKDASVANDIVPLIAKYDAWDSYFVMGSPADAQKQIAELVKKYPNAASVVYRGSVSGTAPGSWSSVEKSIKSCSLTRFAVVSGDAQTVDIDKYFKMYGSIIKGAKLKMRLMFFDLSGEDRFNKMLEYGINAVMTDLTMESCKFVAEKYFS